MSGVGVFRAEARKNQDFILVFRSKLSIIDQYWNGSRPAANRPSALDLFRPRESLAHLDAECDPKYNFK